jgi:asparagine synthase (glutamine-hydrolysing)
MSVQFGRWNLDGKPIDYGYMEKVGSALCPYGPDGKGSYSSTNLSILYYAFHTTKESRSEVQPHICASGAVVTWDGRLDNRADLIGELGNPLTVESTDLALVASVYEQLGTQCFGKLIGDWALSIWNPVEHTLILAKDPIGTHHLYYSFDRAQITWCTVLDPLIRLGDRTFELNREYIAGWLSMFPAAHLTPYVNVHSVPPSSLLLLGPGKHAVKKYWDFDPDKQVRYRTDAEYEEHFRTVFTTAIQRRLRSDQPVLAELSGGRDSSAIVCMADEIIAHGEAECPRLDTISYYDDSEPNWNEHPFFAKVEQKRGRAGWHVDVGERRLLFSPQTPPDRFVPVPGDTRPAPREVILCVTSQGNRALLSGIGGDEVMGGVPDPLPELEDLITKARFGTLAQQLRLWALERKRPWFHLLWEALRGFLPPALIGVPRHLRPAPWLQTNFVRRHLRALTGYSHHTCLFGPPPTFQDAVKTIDALRRQLGCIAPVPEPPLENRYPYLDRSLLEFAFAVPRGQLIRPKQRRSLMRRALAGIVPDEILNRKAKAFVSRSPLLGISRDKSRLVAMAESMLASSLGIVEPESFRGTLQKALAGEVIPVISLLRTIQVEDWLRNTSELGIVRIDKTSMPDLSLLPTSAQREMESRAEIVGPPHRAVASEPGVHKS